VSILIVSEGGWLNVFILSVDVQHVKKVACKALQKSATELYSCCFSMVKQELDAKPRLESVRKCS
jgi:hypothetical protein